MNSTSAAGTALIALISRYSNSTSCRQQQYAIVIKGGLCRGGLTPYFGSANALNDRRCRHCLHQARSAVRCWVSRMKGESCILSMILRAASEANILACGLQQLQRRMNYSVLPRGAIFKLFIFERTSRKHRFNEPAQQHYCCHYYRSTDVV